MVKERKRRANVKVWQGTDLAAKALPMYKKGEITQDGFSVSAPFEISVIRSKICSNLTCKMP